jgi:hypothetical protein
MLHLRIYKYSAYRSYNCYFIDDLHVTTVATCASGEIVVTCTVLQSAELGKSWF